MLRAHVDGLIDYSRCDPDDKLWRRRQRVILDLVEDRLQTDVYARHHDHVLANLPAQGNARRDSQDKAVKCLNEWWKLKMPWMAEQIGTTPDEQAVAAFAAAVGHPGEPEYEAAMAQLDRELRPIPEAEKLRRRRVRQAREAASLRQHRVMVAS